MRGERTITAGADSQKERERKRLELIQSFYDKIKKENQMEGYCGACKTQYKGNYTNHQCTI